MVINGIAYEGIVNIQLKRGKKIKYNYIIHNEGTQLLFQGIASCLVQAPNSKLLPNYIGVGLGGGAKQSPYKLNSEIVRVPIPNKGTIQENLVVSDGDALIGNGWKAIFKATIPSSSLSENTIREIGLFGEKTGDNLLARLTPDRPINVEEGMSVTIEWIMYIKNA